MDYITLNHLKLHYQVSGTGKDIIILHGWGCNIDTYKAVAQNLAPNFKVYVLDFPGFGKSEAPSEVWGVEEYTQLIEQFVKEMGIQSPILMGHSFGGRVSILYASRNNVNKIILVDSAGIKPKRPLKYYFKVYSFKLYKKVLPLLVGKKKAAEQIESYRKKAGSSDYNNSSGIMRNILVKVVNEDLKHVMPKITAPTLLVWGENDTATPVKDAQIMEKLIKGSGLVVFKDAGHYSFLDKPFDFNLVVDHFLNNDKTK